MLRDDVGHEESKGEAEGNGGAEGEYSEESGGDCRGSLVFFHVSVGCAENTSSEPFVEWSDTLNGLERKREEQRRLV